MAATTSLRPIQNDQFDWFAARHLLLRTGYGGSHQQITDLHKLGLSSAVDMMVNFNSSTAIPEPEIDPDIIRPYTSEERLAYKTARKEKDNDTLDALNKERNRRRRVDRQYHGVLQNWWLQRMIESSVPLEERLTLLWHSHFAARHRNVRDAYLMYQQNQFFRANAAGSFATLAEGIVRDPAMLKFLNNNQNNKRRPNENLARELMELFTLGEGNYTEQDIKEGARALTGYTYRDNDFVMFERNHDDGQKKILGTQGNLNADDFVEILLKNKACARYVAFKLYRHFVADITDQDEHWEPSQEKFIDSLASLLAKNQYHLAPVLEALFKSEHFYDKAIVNLKIKSPIQLIANTTRSIGTPTRSKANIRRGLEMMGQQLFDPPGVAGWETGRAWINTSTLLARHNITTYQLTGKMPGKKWKKGDVKFDPMSLISGIDQANHQAVVDHLCSTLLGQTSTDRRQPLVKYLADRDKGITTDSLIGLLLLITTMPEYQLC
ncbi:DUF1800 domain-containing protein [Poriferisphaera sp. WC338]|uniref:DUF1800 domain-containing protein n=1 Tax=Poriferisphaera sp. WC338 TaxID=3425129 RepID=UPI003D817000